MKKNKALVVIAHPDDETIWMGGTILRNKNWNWTIVSVCRSSDADRKPKFDKACKILNAKGFIYDIEDQKLAPIDTKEIKNLVNDSVPEKEFDLVFTHGKNGEYGHIRHLEVHRAVRDMLKSGELKSKKAYSFNYMKGKNVPYPNLKVPEPIEDSDMITRLTDKEIKLKKKIVKDIYGYPNERGFELMSCSQTESFELI